MCRKMCRKLIYLMFFVLMLVFFAGQLNAASMGMDGYSDRVIVCDDGSGNAVWYADASDPNGFGDGIAEVSGGAFGLMTDILMLGDVNGDGIVDRVFARAVGDIWMWVADYSTPTGFGDGVYDSDKGFGSPAMLPHAVVDLDGDGIADRVSIQENNPFPWYLYWGDKSPGGFGDGMHEWASYFGTTDNGTPIGMADMNNDGLADRLVDWFPPDLFWVVDFAVTEGGFGDGNMEAEAWRGGFGAAGMSGFVGDLNADGYGDRAVAYETVGSLYTWEGALSTPSGFGGGNVSEEAPFGSPGDILLLGDVLNYRQPRAGSIGMDGYADRVKICDDGSGNAIWYADASEPGGFGDGVAEVSGTFGLITDVHMLGDVSGDGIVDRVVAYVEGGSWIWEADYSTPTGLGFGDGVADTLGGFGGLWLIPHAVVDLDGDGIADRVGISDNCWYWGDKGPAGGGFGDAIGDYNSPSNFGYPDMTPIGMADLNGDGLADRVIDWFGDGYFAADLALASGGFGDGNWNAGWTGAFGAAGMLAFVGDLNADGCGDRAVAYEIVGNTYTWEGKLSGFGGGSNIYEEASFGTPNDILLMGDVFDIRPLDVTAFPGWDIFNHGGQYNYRYGPSIIINDDNSIDIWFASPGNGSSEWDWIRHKKSYDGGHTWGSETVVLRPTPGSADRCSCCDPGVIKFGGYYYIGYTSVAGPEASNNNHVFVARSTSPTGGFEKWNGSGWGGNPQPFIVYTGPLSDWGAGEPSFVLKDGMLYIYYTWTGTNETRVATAFASNPNWPGSITYQGAALTRFYGEDSTDVKYIDAQRQFIGIAVANRFTEGCYIHVWESTDGLTFTPVDEVTDNIQEYAHNAGISGTPEGHINLDDENFIAHAYGSVWGRWSTHLNPIDIK